MEETSREERLIRASIAKLRAGVVGIASGLLGGAGLMVATLWLVVQGGEDVGKHLGLLVHYFPGYSVSWGGALLGLFYGMILGGVLGWSTAWIYNRIVDLRN